MHFSNQMFISPWIIFFFWINLSSYSLSDPRTSEAALICGQVRAPKNSTGFYFPTFTHGMQILRDLVTNNGWGNASVANRTLPIYSFFQCHRDLSQTDCLLCFAAIRTRIPRCLPSISGRLFFDGCFLRYDNYSFFAESVDNQVDNVICNSTLGAMDSSEAGRLGFKQSVAELVGNLTETAVSKGGFAMMEVKRVFGLAQCWETVSKEGCRVCLEKASKEVVSCVPSRDGRGLNAGCYLRYSTQKFFDENGNAGNGSGGLATGIIVAIGLGAAAFLMLAVFGAYIRYLRVSKLKQERSNLGQISNSYNKSSFNFKYEVLEKATNYFDPSTKVGQGGAGIVYKGTLADGTTVAVKRLLFNTRQWVDEFFNEVNLVGGIQHKNLVKLLGCSIEGPESLLVYEYLPNRSLDQFLFDKTKIQTLNWKQRYNIVVGTAEGLAYLHGGTAVRIIHRDIKGSNILLDENLSPKIADFGLARCFAADKTHLSTGIAGTLGYMAPEYLVRGQLTEKADVYSFGVLVLELTSGRKNNAFIEDSGSLLQTVWKFYKDNNLAESIDPCLKNDFPVNEASNVIQIALLCTQASASLRPSMAEVVLMLTNENCEIPAPSQPPFLNARVLNSARSGGSYSINNKISNALTKIDISCTSTEGSSMQSSDALLSSVEVIKKH